eukprot:TRINITY_DN8951_c0_g1_i1.p1 TRINITY_DN8951_c0_g1~~TRINITY_DN8951_c0_g1_i1.p1  ORF type:complete len:257 (-),score=36.23 TRINITY_DN8951_c0_g1_i1:2-772(-)
MEEDQTGVCFKDSKWLEFWPLNRDTALDYFALSGFYDRTCNNEQLKMQRLPLDKLVQMRGIEYVLFAAKEPDLYVIRKQKRDSPANVTPQTSYYIIKGTIFQAPNLYSVLASRTIKSLYNVQKSFKEAANYVSFDPYVNYAWDFNQQSGGKPPPRQIFAKEAELNKKKEQTFQYAVNRLLTSLSQQYPIQNGPAAAAISAPSALGSPSDRKAGNGTPGKVATPKIPTPGTHVAAPAKRKAQDQGNEADPKRNRTQT